MICPDRPGGPVKESPAWWLGTLTVPQTGVLKWKKYCQPFQLLMAVPKKPAEAKQKEELPNSGV